MFHLCSGNVLLRFGTAESPRLRRQTLCQAITFAVPLILGRESRILKILHCCLAQFYIDDAGYQENILPRVHHLQGHDVAILASTETYTGEQEIGYLRPKAYLTADGIPVRRLPYVSWLPHSIGRKLRYYEGVANCLDEFQPDIVFVHGCQFLDVRRVVEYVKRNPEVLVFVDGHADFINSARNWFSKNILHRLIYKSCAKTIEPYTAKFFGVLPARVTFLEEMYGISPSKTELLVLGVDDTVVNWARRDEIRKQLRGDLGVSEDDFLIVSGGKIDRRKNLHELMLAVSRINSSKCKLLLFGTPTKELQAIFNQRVDHPNIQSIGWIPASKVYDYYFASDLGVFPGTHSVLWEQAVGVGLPCVFKRWPGVEHVDLGGNCEFLAVGNSDEVEGVIRRLMVDRDKVESMRSVAIAKGRQEFSYSEIAKRAISP